MIEAIESRRSVRKYLDTVVGEDDLAGLLEAARLAPSGNNSQPWRFIVIRDERNKKAVAEASHRQTWMTTAPLLIACIADPGARGAAGSVDEESGGMDLKRAIRDTSIAIEHIVLEAGARGLATCWVAWFTQAEIRPVLGLPADKFVVAVLAVGYPAEKPAARSRKPIEDFVRYERW